MIDVKYHRGRNRVTVMGHAHSDEYGKDLVCAAASILVHTLQANAEHLDAMGAGKAVVEVREGYAKVSCVPNLNYATYCRDAFAAVAVGFELLAKQYPQYVSYKVY